MEFAKSPSSGDCEVAAERSESWNRDVQFGTEMAAPVEIEDTNWHRSKAPSECEWKQGDRRGRVARTRRAPFH